MDDHWVLIYKYLKGDITDLEKDVLENWLKSDAKNLQKFKEVKEVWKLTKPFDNLIYNLEEEKQKVLKVIEQSKVEPTKQELPGRQNILRSFLRVAAAILVIFVTAYTTWIFTSNKPLDLSAQIHISNETVTKIDLPDSSRIYLNKQGIISFSQNSKQRSIDLHGEAFFEINREQRPFIINIQHVAIRVLGTSFNVKPSKEGDVIITVVSGKVEVSNGSDRVYLEADEVAMINRSKNVIDKFANSNPNFMSWKNQRLVFNNMELKDVIHALSEYYDITFQIKPPGILDCRFSGSFEKARIETVLEVLAYSLGIEYYYNNNQYILSGEKCK